MAHKIKKRSVSSSKKAARKKPSRSSKVKSAVKKVGKGAFDVVTELGLAFGSPGQTQTSRNMRRAEQLQRKSTETQKKIKAIKARRRKNVGGK